MVILWGFQFSGFDNSLLLNVAKSLLLNPLLFYQVQVSFNQQTIFFNFFNHDSYII